MSIRPLLALSLLLVACGDKDSDSGDAGGDETPSPFETDDDGDGVSEAEGDCDDADADIHPDAVEVCNGLDDDCSGGVDDDATDAVAWYPDADGDTYGADAYVVMACEAPAGHVEVGGDCHDLDAAWYPGAPEDDCADLNDYNCDGSVGSADADSDGFAACEDCDDGDGAVNPGAVEVCDDIDNDCSGDVDDDATDATTWYADVDADGYGDPDVAEVACAQPEGHVEDATDCDDGALAVYPGADELCNDLDDDCDGTIDNDDALDAAIWYADADGDGAGDPLVATLACDQPADTVDNDADCDDGESRSHPGGSEVCDGQGNRI